MNNEVKRKGILEDDYGKKRKKKESNFDTEWRHCLQCDTTFGVHVYTYASGRKTELPRNKKFCKRQCFLKYHGLGGRNQLNDRWCLQCKEHFLTGKHEQKFCSADCRYVWHGLKQPRPVLDPG